MTFPCSPGRKCFPASQRVRRTPPPCTLLSPPSQVHPDPTPPAIISSLASSVCCPGPRQPAAGLPTSSPTHSFGLLRGNQHRVLIFPKKPFKKQHTEFFMAYVRVLVSEGGWEGKERSPFVPKERVWPRVLAYSLTRLHLQLLPRLFPASYNFWCVLVN